MALVLVTGTPGCGKSTLCKGRDGYAGLAQRLDASFYDKDDINDVLFDIVGSDSKDRVGPEYETLIRPLTYHLVEHFALMDLQGKVKNSDSLFEMVMEAYPDKTPEQTQFARNTADHYGYVFSQQASRSYEHVVVDAIYSSSMHGEKAVALKQRWDSLAQQGGTTFTHLRVHASQEKIVERIVRRGRAIDQEKLDDLNAFFAKFPIRCDPVLEPKYISTDQPTDVIIDEAYSHVLGLSI